MGNCTSSSKSNSQGKSGGGSAEIQNSNAIRSQMIQDGLNSRIAGIRRKAEEGTGNYAYKNSDAVSYANAEKIKGMQISEKNGNTVVFGVLNNKAVFFADKSDSSKIANLKKIRQDSIDKREKEQKEATERLAGSNKNTTSTYERWRKANQRKFGGWYGVN